MNYLDQRKICGDKEGNNGRVLTHGYDASGEEWLPEGSTEQTSTSLKASNHTIIHTSSIFLPIITEL